MSFPPRPPPPSFPQPPGYSSIVGTMHVNSGGVVINMLTSTPDVMHAPRQIHAVMNGFASSPQSISSSRDHGLGRNAPAVTGDPSTSPALARPPISIPPPSLRPAISASSSTVTTPAGPLISSLLSSYQPPTITELPTSSSSSLSTGVSAGCQTPATLPSGSTSPSETQAAPSTTLLSAAPRRTLPSSSTAPPVATEPSTWTNSTAPPSIQISTPSKRIRATLKNSHSNNSPLFTLTPSRPPFNIVSADQPSTSRASFLTSLPQAQPPSQEANEQNTSVPQHNTYNLRKKRYMGQYWFPPASKSKRKNSRKKAKATTSKVKAAKNLIQTAINEKGIRVRSTSTNENEETPNAEEEGDDRTL